MKNLHLFILFLSLTACVKKEIGSVSEKENAQYITPVKSLAFDLDSLTDAYTNSSRVYDGFYVHYNRNLPSFYFYSLKDRKLSKRIVLSEKTRAVIGEISYAYYQSPEKIFWLSKTASKIFITNEKSELLESHTFGNLGSIIFHNFMPFHMVNENLFLPNFLTFDPNSLYQNEQPVSFFSYNLKSKTSEYFLHYPEKYKKSIYGANYHLFSVTYDEQKNSAYFLFPADKNIYAVDLGSKKMQKKICTETDDNQEVSELIAFENSLSVQKHYAENPAFQGLVYDKFRKCFYRFKKCASEFSKDETNEPIAPHFEVAVINDNFELKRLHRLKLNDYHANYFITEDGFFISKKSENEDILLFDCYTF